MNTKIAVIICVFLCYTATAQVDITLDQQFNGKYDFLSIGGSMNVADNGLILPGQTTIFTTDNSSANLNLPSDATVIKAYLYWVESYSNNNQTITLNGTQFTADDIFYEDLTQIPAFNFYGYRKDVTDYVVINPSGLYEVTNIDLSAFYQELIPGQPGSQYGLYPTSIVGWSIVIIYEQPSLDYSQINLYDGLIFKGGVLAPTDLNILLTNLEITDSQNSKVEMLSYTGTSYATDPTTKLYFNNTEVDDPPLNPAGSIINSTNTYTDDDEFWNMDLDVFDISSYINTGDTSLDIFYNFTEGTNGTMMQRVVTKVRSELPNTSAYFNTITGQNDCDNRILTIDWVLSNENSTADLNEPVPVSFYYKLENGNEVLLTTVTINQNIPIGQVANFTEIISIPSAAGLEFDLIIRSNDLGDGSFVINETNNLDNTEIIEIILYESPQPLATTNLIQCANLSESFFDLNMAIDQALNPEDLVSFFLSQIDAENNVNAISDPLNYNPQNITETIFLRRFDGSCYAISQFDIESLIPPQINTPTTFGLCDFSDAQLGFADFDLNSKANEITGGNPNYLVNFFTTQADAEDLSITNGISSPYTNENAFNQTIFVRVQDLTNNCLSFTQFDLVVNLLPVIAESSNIPQLESCDNQQNGTAIFDLTLNNSTILDGLNPTEYDFEFYLNFTDAENGNNAIVNPENHTSVAQEMFVRVLNILTGCYSITSFDLIVNEIPALQPAPVNSVCDLNDDGFATFFLPLAENSVIADSNGFSFDYFETLPDAQANSNPINNPTAYQNILTPVQTLYVLVTNDITGCQNIQSIDIEVVPVEFIPFDLTNLEKCEPSLDGINMEMDLTEQEAFIFGSSDPSDYIVTYHFTQGDAASGQNPIVNPDLFLNVQNPQEIWVRLVNTVSNCVEIGTFNYEILLAPVITPPENIPPIDQCANSENLSVQDWDLLALVPTFYDTPELANISFYLTQSDAENNLNELSPNFQNTQNPQQIFVRVEAISSGCVEYTNFELMVNVMDDTYVPGSIEKCDSNNDGIVENFDLQPILDDYAANLPEISLSFHASFNEALTQSNPLSTPYQNTVPEQQTIYLYTFNSITNCEQIFDLDLIAVPIPLLNEITELRVCDSDEDDTALFDLTQIEDEALGDLDPAELAISYYTTLENAELDTDAIPQPGSFENTELPQTIWIKVTDQNNTNNCFDIKSFQLGIDFLPVANQPNDLFLCDDENYDLIEIFDFSVQNDSILNGLSADDNTISYYTSLLDAENKVNPIGPLYSNENSPQTIYVRLENNAASECFTTTSFDIEVLEKPFIESISNLIICENEPLVISIDDGFDSYLWSTGETTSFIIVTEPGIYEVTGIIEYQDQNCETTATFEVSLSSEATITDLTVIDWRQNDNSITVFVQGNGDYEYSIDGVNYQDSNSFEELTEYEYLIHIRDKNGCGETLKRVCLLDYPRFFTPNGDGFNDRWQIINSGKEVFTKIYIFDRYGKLIVDINPAGIGWDGTGNGKPLPSNEYWFRVERQDGRIHTGHFTLKR